MFSSRLLLVETQGRAALPPNQNSLPQNRPNHSAQSNSDEQQALAALNSQSLENDKDFIMVHDSQEHDACAYGVATTQTLRKPVGVGINLRHQ